MLWLGSLVASAGTTGADDSPKGTAFIVSIGKKVGNFYGACGTV